MLSTKIYNQNKKTITIYADNTLKAQSIYKNTTNTILEKPNLCIQINNQCTQQPSPNIQLNIITHTSNEFTAITTSQNTIIAEHYKHKNLQTRTNYNTERPYINYKSTQAITIQANNSIIITSPETNHRISIIKINHQNTQNNKQYFINTPSIPGNYILTKSFPLIDTQNNELKILNYYGGSAAHISIQTLTLDTLIRKKLPVICELTIHEKNMCIETEAINQEIFFTQRKNTQAEIIKIDKNNTISILPISNEEFKLIKNISTIEHTPRKIYNKNATKQITTIQLNQTTVDPTISQNSSANKTHPTITPTLQPSPHNSLDKKHNLALTSQVPTTTLKTNYKTKDSSKTFENITTYGTIQSSANKTHPTITPTLQPSPHNSLDKKHNLALTSQVPTTTLKTNYKTKDSSKTFENITTHGTIQSSANKTHPTITPTLQPSPHNSLDKKHNLALTSQAPTTTLKTNYKTKDSSKTFENITTHGTIQSSANKTHPTITPTLQPSPHNSLDKKHNLALTSQAPTTTLKTNYKTKDSSKTFENITTQGTIQNSISKIKSSNIKTIRLISANKTHPTATPTFQHAKNKTNIPNNTQKQTALIATLCVFGILAIIAIAILLKYKKYKRQKAIHPKQQSESRQYKYQHNSLDTTQDTTIELNTLNPLETITSRLSQTQL